MSAAYIGGTKQCNQAVLLSGLVMPILTPEVASLTLTAAHTRKKTAYAHQSITGCSAQVGTGVPLA